MKVIHEHQYLNIEFDWIASDSEQFVGYFATAGAGPIPAVSDEMLFRMESLPEMVHELPVIAEIEVNPAYEHLNIKEWADVASRGMYAFDWRREKGCYEWIARPHQALIVQAVDGVLPPALAQLELRFRSADRIVL